MGDFCDERTSGAGREVIRGRTVGARVVKGVRGVRGRVKKVHRCGECNRTFPRWMNLKEHMGVHQGKQHVCAQCQQSYSQASNLRHHVTDMHTGVIFGCVVCGFRSARSDSVRRHMRTHYAPEREKELKDQRRTVAAIDVAEWAEEGDPPLGMVAVPSPREGGVSGVFKRGVWSLPTRWERRLWSPGL